MNCENVARRVAFMLMPLWLAYILFLSNISCSAAVSVSLSLILLLFLYLHIYRPPKAFKMKQKSCEVSELCCHLRMWGCSIDWVQSAEEEVGLWQGGIYLASSMSRVVLHDPALSSGSPQGPCATQLLLHVLFFPAKIYETWWYQSIWSHSISSTDFWIIPITTSIQGRGWLQISVSFSSWKETSFSLVLKLLRWSDRHQHCKAAVVAREVGCNRQSLP